MGNWFTIQTSPTTSVSSLHSSDSLSRHQEGEKLVWCWARLLRMEAAAVGDGGRRWWGKKTFIFCPRDRGGGGRNFLVANHHYYPRCRRRFLVEAIGLSMTDFYFPLSLSSPFPLWRWAVGISRANNQNRKRKDKKGQFSPLISPI